MLFTKWKPYKVISTVTLCATILFTGGLTSHATSKIKDSKEIENIQGAYYYVDDVRYEVPKEELGNFVSGKDTVNLPYDPKNEPNTNQIVPFGEACVAGYEFAGTRRSSGFKLGKSGDRVINKTSQNLTQVSSLSSSTTISGSVSGSGSWSWGPINATAGFNIGGSYTWTTAQSTSITVSPGDWGWIDYGTHSETWAGDYYYLTGTCYRSGLTYLTVNGPKYKAVLAKTERYPY